MYKQYLNANCSRAIITLLVGFGLIILFGGNGVAADQVRVLTIDEALQIALEKNRDIQKAEEFRNKVMGKYVEERAAAFPQLVINAAGIRGWDDAMAAVNRFSWQETKSAEATLTQPLFTWGQIGAAIRGAKFGIATADDRLRAFRQAALRDVSVAFYDALLASETHGIARQNLSQKTDHLDETRRKFDAGIATDYDVLAAEVVVQNARPDVIRMDNLIKTSRDKLRFLLGLSEQVDVNGQLNTPIETEQQYEDALKIAYQRRPELSDLRNQIGISEELVKVVGAGNKPRLDLKASGGYKEFTIPSYQSDGKTWSIGLFVTFPLFDGLRTQGKVAQAKSDVASLKIEEAKTKDSIALQIRDSVNAVKEAADIVSALTGTVSQAERLLFMAQKGYEYGVKTHLEVQDAELNLTQAKGNLAKARRDYLSARVTLTWATGTLGE